MTDYRADNQAFVRFLLLPTIFLTVALCGGLRVSADGHAFVFVAPPLVTLILSALLMLLFVRSRLLDLSRWLTSERHPLTNISQALTLATLFFASAQSFNSVLPESGLLRWMLSFFFLWTLWNNQFSSFDARRLVRSLAALFGTAFAIKHLLLANLYTPDGGWLNRLAGALLEGVTQGRVGAATTFAPATGYISFFTLALYVAGLILLPAAPADAQVRPTREFVRDYRQLSPAERLRVREAVLRDELMLSEKTNQLEAADQVEAEISAGAVESSAKGEK